MEHLNYTDVAFRPYVTALGQLALTWNRLNTYFALIFCTCLDGGHIYQYMDVWQAVSNDRSQRAMLLATVRHKGCAQARVHNRLVADIEWACGQADKLEEIRNNAIHSPLIGFSTIPNKPVIKPLTGLGHVRAKKLLNKDLLFEFRYCRDACAILQKFLVDIDCAIKDGHRLWPEQPRLSSRKDSGSPKPTGQKRPSKQFRAPMKSRPES